MKLIKSLKTKSWCSCDYFLGTTYILVNDRSSLVNMAWPQSSVLEIYSCSLALVKSSNKFFIRKSWYTFHWLHQNCFSYCINAILQQKRNGSVHWMLPKCINSGLKTDIHKSNEDNTKIVFQNTRNLNAECECPLSTMQFDWSMYSNGRRILWIANKIWLKVYKNWRHYVLWERFMCSAK